MATDEPLEPVVKHRLGSLLRHTQLIARSGAGPAYLRWQRRRRRAARRAAEARGEQHLSRPALHDLDRKLEPYIGDITDGYFVEAGANDGFEQSNTYHLERFHGWRGLLVEPVPHLHREAAIERPSARVVHAALVAPDFDGTEVSLQYGGLMTVVAGSKGSSSADEEYVANAFALGLDKPMVVSAPARTLTALLDQSGAPEIDFMSLDLEGYEPAALQGLDLTRHAPRYLLVEVRDEEGRATLAAVLGERYRFEGQLTPQDALYARSDQPSRG